MTVFSKPVKTAASSGIRAAVLCLMVLGGAFALPAAPVRAGDGITLLVIGDSLTAGYGLKRGDGFTDQLQAHLDRVRPGITVVNGGVSGDTTAGGRARLDWMLADAPDAVILELGGNDGLRGLDPTETEANLDAMLVELAKREIPVLLAGMQAPPNMGEEYAADFRSVFPRLAGKHGVVFYPFFLEGVAGKLSLNQDDAIHPNANGVARIVENILPAVAALLDRVKS